MREIILAGIVAVSAISSSSAQTPVLNARKISSNIVVDGNPSESDWQVTTNCSKTIIGTPNNTTQFGVLWNNQYLYVAYTVTDANRFNDSQNEWDDDGIELYIDADNNGGTTYGTNDRQFMKGWNSSAIREKNSRTTGVLHAWTSTANGYSVELAIPWSNIAISNPAAGLIIGFDVANNDDDNGGAREHQSMWAGDNDNWRYPRNFGDLLLTDVVDTLAPSVPTNLAAGNITQTSLELTWDASIDNVAVTGYDVYRNGSKINTSLVTSLNYTVTDLTAATPYSFYVVARDAAGNTSDNSNTVDITIPDTQAPAAPFNLAASSITQTSLTLSWNASTDNVGVTGYDVYQDNVKINTLPVTVTNYSVSGLTPSTTYAFYVVAFDAAGNTSANSNTINVTTASPPDTIAPTGPTNLVASGITSSSFVLNWDASSDNIGVTGYDVYVNNDKVNMATITSTVYTVTGLSELTTYQVSVRAKDLAGNFADSDPISVITTAGVGCTGTGAINFQRWNNITGTSVTNLTSNANYPNSPSTTGTLISFEMPTNAAENYGARVYGYICPPVTGSYTFWIASDDNSELWLSTTSSPSNRQRIAYHTQWTNSREWNKYTTQKSAAITLTAGQLYYVEALMKEGTQGDNLAVGWAKPGQSTTAPGEVIPGTSLVSGITDNEAPTAPSNLSATNIASTSCTLNWTASTDNIGVAGYDVYRDGVKINSSLVTSVTYNVTGLTASTAYSFYVTALDGAGNVSAASNTINVTTTTGSSCTGIGSINFQRWNNITGTSVTNLTSNANYPNNPGTTGTLTSFEMPTNAAENYGARIYGYICPPVTGSYTFWIASDDNSELWLSTTSSPSNRQRIAYHTQWTNSREWNKYTTQKSAAITLAAGQLYFVEALMKEGAQGDNLAVGWARPGQSTTAPSEVIPGTNLVSAIADNEAPSAPFNLSATNIAQTSCTLNWSASTDNIGVAGYDVYRNGVKINTSVIAGLSYNVTGLTASTTYAFSVKAKDLAGNESVFSQSINVTTLAANPGSETFTQRTVISNQRMPHDLVYGPDNNLWYTERFAGTVSFVNPASGARTVVLTLGSKMVRAGGQDGLMGLALHPQFTSGKPYVYISYTYQSTSNTVRKTRIERYTYNGTSLGSPVTILENIPGSNDHNSARLSIGPDLKLYYSVGDMGAGQFDNQNRTNNAQNLGIYEGKILRLNTEEVAGSWIPADNPFTSGELPTAVYSFGHRNPQGLVWGNVNGTDILYSSEHGPYSDDEINVIERARNFGWPNVIGFCDGNYNGRTTGGFSISNEQNNCTSLNAKEPLRSIFPVANPPEGGDNMTWPSMAPSGMDFYGSTAIPNWQNSVLVAMLKSGTITRFKLSNNGQSIISDTINYFRGKGRFRDVVISPDGLKIYVACDSSGSTSGPTGGVTSTPANPGSILEFTYQPSSMRGDLIVAEQFPVEENTKDRSIDVYPNPASAYVIVYNYGTFKGRVVELMDMNGRLVRRQAVTNLATRMETNGFANGLYILRVTDEKGKVIRTEKVIVQR
jgi:PQQ-dependent dehydrogenase (s-GDH family)